MEKRFPSFKGIYKVRNLTILSEGYDVFQFVRAKATLNEAGKAARPTIPGTLTRYSRDILLRTIASGARAFLLAKFYCTRGRQSPAEKAAGSTVIQVVPHEPNEGCVVHIYFFFSFLSKKGKTCVCTLVLTDSDLLVESGQTSTFDHTIKRRQ